MDYREKLKTIGDTFGIDLTPENVDDVYKKTWEKYYALKNKSWNL